MKLTIIRVIAVLLIVAAIGLYAYGVLVNGDKPPDNLLRTAIIALSGVSALMKTFPKRRALNEYASAFTKELGNAFADDMKKREKLLEAVRLFDEDKNNAALKVLDDLRQEARTQGRFRRIGCGGAGSHSESAAGGVMYGIQFGSCTAGQSQTCSGQGRSGIGKPSASGGGL